MKSTIQIILFLSFSAFILKSYAQQDSQNDCEKSRKQITILQNEIKTLLESCDITKAKSLITEINDKYSTCISLFQQDTQNDLLIDIMIKEKSLQQFINLKKSISSELAKNNCKEAAALLDRVKNDLKCKTPEIAAYIIAQEKIIKECYEKQNLLKGVAILKDQLNKFQNLPVQEMNNSLAEIDQRLDVLKKSDFNPDDVKSLVEQRNELEKFMKEKQVETEKKNRTEQLTQYGRIVKPEILIGVGNTIPYFSPVGNNNKEVAPTYIVSKNNLSYGLGLRIYNRRKGKGIRLGAKLENFEMTLFDLPDEKFDSFEATNLNVELKRTLDGKKAYHPIFASYGVGGNIPISLKYSNQSGIALNTKGFKKNDYLNYSVYSVLGLGTGLERKNLGISLEASVKLGGILSPFVNDEKTQTINTDNFFALFYGYGLTLTIRPF